MNQLAEEQIPTMDVIPKKNIPLPVAEERTGPLLATDVAEDLRAQWNHIQAGFVDEPRTAVQQADDLVSHAIKRLSDSFTEARNNLESQWGRGEDVSTEDLRIALRKYRAFFERLLTV